MSFWLMTQTRQAAFFRINSLLVTLLSFTWNVPIHSVIPILTQGSFQSVYLAPEQSIVLTVSGQVCL